MSARVNAQDCIHHWEIPPANGPKSAGVCRKCGQEKEFLNYIPHDPFGYARRSGSPRETTDRPEVRKHQEQERDQTTAGTEATPERKS